MNDDQLEACLKDLKSSSREPDTIDSFLEERVMKMSSNINRKQIRTKRLIVILSVLLVSATGFVALGGDSAVVNYISPSTEKDADGNTVPYDFSIGKWLHNMHDHIYDHFHRQHGEN